MKVKVDKNFNIYYSIFLMYFVPRCLEYTTFMEINGLATVCSLLKNLSYVLILMFAIYKYWHKDYFTAKFICIACVLFLYFTYQGFFEDEKAIFVVFIFSLPFNEDRFDDFINRTYYTSLILFILTIVSCMLGIINNVTTDFDKLNVVSMRNSAGFNYPGQLIMSLMPIVFMYYYINRDKITLKKNIMWILIDIVAFAISKTVMGFCIIILFILLFNFMYKRKIVFNNEKIKKLLIIYLPYISFVFTLFLLWLYSTGNPIGAIIDKVVNGRLNLGNIFIDMFGVELFGTDFVNSTEYYYQVLDSEYMYMLVAAGIIYTFLALKLMEICIRFHIDNKVMVLLWMLLFLNAIVNNGVFNYVFNPFCIVLVPAIKHYIKSRKKIIVASDG